MVFKIIINFIYIYIKDIIIFIKFLLLYYKIIQFIILKNKSNK